ncbi:hypothetical protein [Sandaracinus amylolyticus]|uniref:TonB C-terminal domain-containing protein n=1 Tax=Sandaracinus amylolyticus TaxID=927083 RepID=A0A0F6YHK8_9BACT|nr:hypothetical protein [Sandaracinus amylolyticus]AKF05803.1 hypothetical protein DB32_002952 [Sandaracinus amylolyticus]
MVAPALAHADQERAVATLESLQDACRIAQARPARELLVVDVEPGWTFGTLSEDGFLAIESRRNFRALGGRVELYPARLEPLGLVATAERADELEAARQRGARLRIGFFLGFDEPERTSCVLRSRHAVSTVRMDVGYVELLAEDGAVLAREDTERYRAWRDDAERQAVPGEGPRAALGTPSTPSGAVPEPWQTGVVAAGTGEVARALAVCHRDGIARGAETTGRIVVRVRVDGRTGRVVESRPAISDVGDSAEAECVAGALRAITLPPVTSDARTFDLDVPVRVVAD